MKRGIAVIGLSVYCLIVLLGCAAFSKKEGALQRTPSLLQPANMLKFTDVPVPMGFKLLPQDSYNFESSGVRVGVLRYRGKANADQVINFYKEQMPMYNWALLNIMEYGERLMNFERENESCIVTLSPKGNAVTITVSLGPKAQVPKKSKPIK